MPRTKGSKNRPKTNTTNDYASQIAEKQESIVSLTAEIASITANIDTLKADLKEKKTALKKAEMIVRLLIPRHCANSSCVKECFFRRSRTFSPNFMFATFLWRSYRAVTMCNGICKYSIWKMQRIFTFSS